MAKAKKEKDARHKILREAYRHWPEFKALVTYSTPDPPSGKYGNQQMVMNSQRGDLKHVIEYGGITLSFFDLERALVEARLAPRKREAFFWNVLMDMKQKDVAEKMGITTVSVGQYVEQAMLQIAEVYFASEDAEELKKEETNVNG